LPRDGVEGFLAIAEDRADDLAVVAVEDAPDCDSARLSTGAEREQRDDSLSARDRLL
jgi:hypothetical protein